MIRNGFRPWGGLHSILKDFPNRPWSFVGCISMEDRCLAARETLLNTNAISQSLLFRIKDGHSRYTQEVESKTDINEAKFIATGVQVAEIKKLLLLGRHGDIQDEIQNFLLNATSKNLIIDISSLPKKFFFLLIRKALETNSQVFENILITYTEPESYSSKPLAENPEVWKPLPGFNGPRVEPPSMTLIIGLGYEPLGLPDLYSSGLFNNGKIRLLFPFPTSHSSVARNWEFARLLEPAPGNASTEIERIDSLNVPDVFDKISSLTLQGSEYSILAPFGPKPVSLAMCLFASSLSKSPIAPSVFYTQPTVYNPAYSSGVKSIDGNKVINAYCIRLHGDNLYSV